MVLHYYLDLTLPEAAKALGIPVGTAKSRLHRSLQALRITVTSDDTSALPSSERAVPHDAQRPIRPAPSRRAWWTWGLERPRLRRRHPGADRPHAAAARLDLPRKVDPHGRDRPTTRPRRAAALADARHGRARPPAHRRGGGGLRRYSVGEVAGSVRRSQERADRLCRVRRGVHGEPGRRAKATRSRPWPTGPSRSIRSSPTTGGGSSTRRGPRRPTRVSGRSGWSTSMAPAWCSRATEPLQDTTWYGLSPDGRSIVFVSSIAGTESISFVNLDGSGRRTLDLGVPVGSIAFRPPDGKQLLVHGRSAQRPRGARNLPGERGRHGPPTGGQGRVGGLRGRRVVRRRDPRPVQLGGRTPAHHRGRRHRGPRPPVGRDRLGALAARSRPTARRSSSSAPTTPTGWSRASSGPTGPAPPVDITGAVLETGSRYQWSPDSTVILARPNEISSQQQLWDPTTGQARIAPWPAESYPTWQRLAP